MLKGTVAPSQGERGRMEFDVGLGSVLRSVLLRTAGREVFTGLDHSREMYVNEPS